MNDKEFRNYKTQVLEGKDLSKKGEVDVEIAKIIESINTQNCFVTLSSCSGRSIVISQDGECQKKGCNWLYVTHGQIDADELCNVCNENSTCDLVVKFEPFILHVGCQNLEAAKRLLTCALSCGYRNSGIVLGASGKITLAVRSTLNMEVPVSGHGKLFADREYLQYLAHEANNKMDKNFKQIKKFENMLIDLFN